MLESDVYSFVLDLFPLTDAIGDESVVLCGMLQTSGLELLTAANAGFPVINLIERIDVLLLLTRDLGHIDNEVYGFLSRQLRKIYDSSFRDVGAP